MSAFVEAEIATTEQQLAEEAIAKLKEELELKGITGWVPNESALEIILLKVIAGMAQNANLTASAVLNATFQQFGVQLIKLALNEGAYATANTKWTIVPEAAVRHIPAGTTLEGGGKAFEVAVETEVPSSASEVTKVQVRAIERGAGYNGVSGVLQQVNPISYVSEVQVEGTTEHGEEEETAEAYRSRLAAALQLQAPRPITAGNFAEFVLDSTIEVEGKKATVGRATCIDGYSPESAGKGSGNATIEAKTNSSTELTEVESESGSIITTSAGVALSLESASLPQKHPGAELHYPGDTTYAVLPRGTTAVSRTGAHKLKISVAALESKAKHTLEVIGSFENQRTVTVFVASKAGGELTSEERETVVKYLEKYRELNFVIYVRSASYNPIYVKTKIHCLPGYTAAGVAESVKAAIVSYLSAETWGNPEALTTGQTSWLNCTEGFNVVRYNQVVGAIERVPGVAYVFSGSAGLGIGTTASPSGTADITMFGPAPLPECPTGHVEVTTE